MAASSLQWPASVPKWLAKDGWKAVRSFPDFDLGSEAKELTWAPVGPNMAFRKTLFDRYGPFRTDPTQPQRRDSAGG